MFRVPVDIACCNAHLMETPSHTLMRSEVNLTKKKSFFRSVVIPIDCAFYQPIKEVNFTIKPEEIQTKYLQFFPFRARRTRSRRIERIEIPAGRSENHMGIRDIDPGTAGCVTACGGVWPVAFYGPGCGVKRVISSIVPADIHDVVKRNRSGLYDIADITGLIRGAAAHRETLYNCPGCAINLEAVTIHGAGVLARNRYREIGDRGEQGNADGVHLVVIRGHV